MASNQADGERPAPPERYRGFSRGNGSTRMEAYKGMLFDTDIKEGRGGRFTAEALIFEESGDSLIIRQALDDRDAVLNTREEAEQFATWLAKDWIEENE